MVNYHFVRPRTQLAKENGRVRDTVDVVQYLIMSNNLYRTMKMRTVGIHFRLRNLFTVVCLLTNQTATTLTSIKLVYIH